ncbi:MAG: hexitol phosphatase HxpB [Patescibacteria group bacterium]|nr:hexitol phosphatase HxpB [Patescibacteria group bacterium]
MTEEKNLIKAVIFDMDGVLINSMPFWKEGLKEVVKKNGSQFKEKLWQELKGGRVDEVISSWHKVIPLKNISLKKAEEEIVNKVVERIRQKGELKKGARKILDFLEKKELKIALASSSYKKVVMAVLEKFGLKKYFQVIHSSEEDNYGKPHPEIYLKTLKELEVDSVNCFCFEDSENGLIAARAARIKVVAVPASEDRDDKVFSLAEFKLNSLNEFNEKIWQKLNHPEPKKEPTNRKLFQVIGFNLAKISKGLDKYIKKSDKERKK